jgi:hypothetical protein
VLSLNVRPAKLRTITIVALFQKQLETPALDGYLARVFGLCEIVYFVGVVSKLWHLNKRADTFGILASLRYPVVCNAHGYVYGGCRDRSLDEVAKVFVMNTESGSH